MRQVASRFVIRLTVGALLALWSVAPGTGIASADAASPVNRDLATANQGLGPGGHVPAWAKGKAVYFKSMRDRSAARAQSQGFEAASGALVQPALGNHTTKGVGCEAFNKTTGACVHYYEPGIHRYDSGPNSEPGIVMHEPQVYFIYWGHEFETEPAVEGFRLEFWLTDTFVAAEAQYGTNATYMGLIDQYHDNSSPGKVTLAGTWHDKSVTAPTHVTEATFIGEINKAITTNHWPEGKNDLFMVFMPKAATWESSFGDNGCAIHGVLNEATSEGATNGNEASYAWVPYAGSATFKGQCLEDLPEKHTSAEEHVDAFRETDASATHEFAEAVTDPGYYGGIKAYTNLEGYEIADICQDNGGAVKLGPDFGAWFELLWSNEEALAHGNSAGCTVQDPPPAELRSPSDTTEPATNISYHEATLNGTVDPNELETTYVFEYGITTGYGVGVPTPPGNAGWGETAIPVAAAAANLNYNTTYHYRIAATDVVGTTYGADRTFTTPFPPPEVRSKPAAYVGPTIATVRGEVSTFNEVGRTTYFEYGPTTSYGSKTSEVKEGSFGGWNEVSTALSGLVPNTMYHYRIASYTNGGTSYGPDASFTTTASPMAVTESPSQISAHEATLNATINPGGHATTYQFELWPTGKSSEVTSLPATPGSAGSGTALVVVSQKATGLMARAYYTYRIRASNSLATTYGETATLVPTTPLAVESTPKPEGATEAKFRHVSCGSPIACIATGEGTTASGVVAERWTGAEWLVQTLPAPAETHIISAGATTCTASTSCWMLTEYEGAGKGGPAVDRWNGSTWSVEALPLPSGGTHVKLNGIACTSVINCDAAGRYEASGKIVTLAEQYNGTWTVTKTPNPTGMETSELSGVSCTSSSACTAVGNSTYFEAGSGETFSQVLAERWNGTEWVIQAGRNPAGSNRSLQSVSCTAATACMAVGTFGTGNNGKPPVVTHSLTEQWNGTEWAVVPTPEPPLLGGNGGLSGVSCTSASTCMAVGTGVVENWNGSEWTVGSWTKPSSEGSEGNLSAVSCVQASCTAVGDYSEHGSQTLAEALAPPVAESIAPTNVTTTTATLNATLNPYGYETTYQFEYGPTQAYGTRVPASEVHVAAGWRNESVSTSATGLHLQEGPYHYRLVATNTDGTTYSNDQTIAPRTWSVLTTPNPSGGTANALLGVSCASLSSCVGVGSYKNSSGTELPLSESWNGTAWGIQTAVVPSGGKEAVLQSVSCTASNACSAVGAYHNSAGELRSLAERWNGTEWTIQSTPLPTGATGTTLYGVSCSTATSCIAVGYYQKTGTYLTLADRWNGTEWTQQTSPNGTGSINMLESVSCTSTTACTAVGNEFTETLVVRWNGTSWTTQSGINHKEAYKQGFSGVSCATATSCTAVGFYKMTAFGASTAVVQGWNGTEWTSQTPVGAPSSVSCASASICTGLNGGAFGSEIEASNGAEWTSQIPATPTGGKEVDLIGISCTANATCIAVGHYTNSAGTQQTLAEEPNS
jgi:hypothetical protein